MKNSNQYTTTNSKYTTAFTSHHCLHCTKQLKLPVFVRGFCKKYTCIQNLQTKAELLFSNLNGRVFRVELEDELLELKEIRVGVPQGCVLGLILLAQEHIMREVYTYDLLQADQATVTFAGDKALISRQKPSQTSTSTRSCKAQD